MHEYKKLSKKIKETNLMNEKLSDQLSIISKEKDELVLKNQTLKNDKINLEESIKDLKKKNKDLISKTEEFSKELEKAKSLVDRFTLISNKVKLILRSQQVVFDKVKLGYRSYYKQKSANNSYKKSSKDNIVCFYCEKLGHKTYSCYMRRNPNAIKTK